MKKTNYLIGSIFVSIVGVWLFIQLYDDDWPSLISNILWAILLGLWSVSLLAKAFGRTLSGIVKNFFKSDVVKTAGSMIKSLLKFAFGIGIAILVIWLIIAFGPLWIIAIILLLIFFAMANK